MKTTLHEQITNVEEFKTLLHNCRSVIAQLLETAWEIGGSYSGEAEFESFDAIKSGREQIKELDDATRSLKLFDAKEEQAQKFTIDGHQYTLEQVGILLQDETYRLVNRVQLESELADAEMLRVHGQDKYNSFLIHDDQETTWTDEGQEIYNDLVDYFSGIIEDASGQFKGAAKPIVDVEDQEKVRR